MKVLSTLLIKTGKLTPAKSSPQDPVEYLQQVLVPECGRRLINQDIQSGRTRTPTDVDEDPLKTATVIMHESAEFGNLVHPHPDDEVEDDIRPNRTSSIREEDEKSKFSHFFDQQSDSDDDNGEREDE
jgi:RTC4-like domain